MKIVVVGGSGRIGARLVTMLARDDHEVMAASRRSGVDPVTGEGLAGALSGASVVVDVTDSTSSEDAAVMNFFTTSTQNLLGCEAAVGVGHHVVLSVVGTERLVQSGYFRAKFAQEKLIKDSPHARHFGAELNERSLIPGDEAELGEIRFDEWLGRTAASI